MQNISFYELDFDSGYGMVIKGIREPDIKEAQNFIEKYGSKEIVIGIFPITEKEARLLSEKELRWLLDGLELDQPKAIKNGTKGSLY